MQYHRTCPVGRCTDAVQKQFQPCSLAIERGTSRKSHECRPLGWPAYAFWRQAGQQGELYPKGEKSLALDSGWKSERHPGVMRERRPPRDEDNAQMSPTMSVRMLEDLIEQAKERALSVEAIAAVLDETAAVLLRWPMHAVSAHLPFAIDDCAVLRRPAS